MMYFQSWQVKRRKQELKHAQDVKELYERKLERVNDLFMELNAWKLQLEEAERVLNKRERQLNIQVTISLRKAISHLLVNHFLFIVKLT